jgi:hypothetical protein
VTGVSGAKRQRILLLDNGVARGMNSCVLNAAGYDVQSTGNEAEAHALCQSVLPTLVLVAANESLRQMWEIAWKFQRAYPQQRIAFLYTDSIQLCALFHAGNLMQKAEGPDDLIERVGTLIGIAEYRKKICCDRSATA